MSLRHLLQWLQRRHVAKCCDPRDIAGMAKGAKDQGKGDVPPVVSTLPPPEPVKARRKRAIPDDIPRGALPVSKRKAAQAKPAPVAKPKREPRAKSEAADSWDGGREAMLAKQAVLERQKSDGIAREFTAPAKPARKAKAETVERRLEPMPHGGALKRSTADKPDPREKEPPKPSRTERKPRVPMTEDLFRLICMEMAEEHTPLAQICRRDDRPSKSEFFRYKDGDDLKSDDPAAPDIRSARLARYARARKDWLDGLVEESLEIADDATNDWIEREMDSGRIDVSLDRDHVQRSKLRIETRIKLAALLDPVRYGNLLKLGDPQAKPMDQGGKSASDIAIGMAKLLAAAQREIKPQGSEA
jgi:hypothetical protein